MKKLLLKRERLRTRIVARMVLFLFIAVLLLVKMILVLN